MDRTMILPPTLTATPNPRSKWGVWGWTWGGFIAAFFLFGLSLALTAQPRKSGPAGLVILLSGGLVALGAGCGLVGRRVRQFQAEIDDLIRSKAAAQESNRAKAAAIASTSHALRTPATAIIGFADLLASPPSEEKRIEWTQMLCANVEELIGLIRALGGEQALPGNPVREGSAVRTFDAAGSGDLDTAHGSASLDIASRLRSSDPEATHSFDAIPLLTGRVLLAEDNAANARLIAEYLGRAGIDLTLVTDGEAAFQQATSAWQQNRPFDLLLMDIHMPVQDGYATTIRLRNRGYRRPIVALTASATISEREKCLTAGCTDFIPKPIDPDQLYAVIGRHLQAGAAARVAA